jgi:hypothetical protein
MDERSTERATPAQKALLKALREADDRAVPDSINLWPAIRERVSEERALDTTPRRPWLPRLVPNTPLGRTLAVLSMLILGAGAYAASGPVRELFLENGLPGPAGPGQGEHTGAEQSDAELSGLRTEMNQTRTADGARVTLDWAYADERFVAVGLHTQALNAAQKPEGSDSGSVALEPSLFDDTVGNEAEFPPHVQITDASGQDFDTVGGGTGLGRGRADAVFDALEGLQPGRKHRFRLEVPLIYGSGRWSGAPGPFDFVFEVPVLPAPTIEVDQEVESKGITGPMPPIAS